MTNTYYHNSSCLSHYHTQYHTISCGVEYGILPPIWVVNPIAGRSKPDASPSMTAVLPRPHVDLLLAYVI